MTLAELELQLNTGYAEIPLNTTVEITENLVIPRGATLKGFSGLSSNGESIDSKLLLSGNGAVVMNSNSALKSLTITRKDSSTSASGLDFSGTGVKLVGGIVGDIEIESCNIFGFITGIDLSTPYNKGRIHIDRVNIDAKIGIRLRQALDVVYLSNIHLYPFLGNAVVGGNINARRQSLLELGGLVDWLQVSNCFSHSAESFISGTGLTGTISGGGYDFESYGNGIGTAIAINNDDRAGDVSIVGVHFNGGHCHIRVNQQSPNPSKRLFNLTGCSFKDAGWGFVDIVRGNGAISGCTFGQINSSLDWIGQVQNDSNVVSTANIYSKTRLGQWANIGTGKVLEGQCLVV